MCGLLFFAPNQVLTFKPLIDSPAILVPCSTSSLISTGGICTIPKTTFDRPFTAAPTANSSSPKPCTITIFIRNGMILGAEPFT